MGHKNLLFLPLVFMLYACAHTADQEVSKPRSIASEPRPVKVIPTIVGPRTIEQSGQTPPMPPVVVEGTGRFVQPPKTSAALPEGNITLNFDGADIREVVRAVLGDLLKRNYIIDPKVTGTVTIHTEKPLPKEAVLPTLATLLRMNGAALTEEQGVFYVLPQDMAKSSKIVSGLAGADSLAGAGLVVVPLRYISALEMQKMLTPILPPGTLVRADTTRNLLLLSGAGPSIGDLLSTVRSFDVNWLEGMSLGLFPLNEADAKEVAKELEAIFFSGKDEALAGVVRIVPIERLNALLVITQEPLYLQKAKGWIERLDRDTGQGGESLWVYMVQNGRADQLAEVLAKLFGEKEAKAEGEEQNNTAALTQNLEGVYNERRELGMNEPIFQPKAKQQAQTPKAVAAELDLGGRQKVRVVSDPNNNALLIWGRESDYKKIENAIRKLDVIPRQVLIEVNIFEVTLNNDLRYGVEWYFSHGAGSRTAGGGGVFPEVVPPWSAAPGSNQSNYSIPNTMTDNTITANNGGSLGAQAGNLGIISQYGQNSLPGFSYFLKGAGGDIRAMVNLLEEVSNVNMLASPHLLVTDHQLARIRVGEEVPLQMGEGVTTVGAVSSYDYRETGVLLSVTPHINPGGLISLQVSQEVSTPQQNTYQIQSPVINKRALDTLVVANSGETIALGGLIRDDQVRGRRGIPLLSEIPVLGVLFGSRTQASRRTELLLTMTPKVIADGNQAREATEELRAKMKAIGDTFQP